MTVARPRDVCLQCGKTRTEVKDRYNFPCATATYGEYVEGLDDWPRHHWRDWSDAELKRHGLTESRFEDNRRTDIYDLEFPARSSHCERKGEHTYPRPWHPPMHRDFLEMYWGVEDMCLICYETKEKEAEEWLSTRRRRTR